MIESKFTREPEWLAKWDEFLVKSQKGSHLILSDWLKSYESYGFDFEIGILLDNNEIVGGFGVIIPKVLFFKFYIIPHGPVFKLGYETHFKAIMQETMSRAKALRCCYLQISVPISSNKKIENHTYNPNEIQFLKSLFKQGKLFNYVYSSYGINWVELKNENEENLLNALKTNTRRDIRAGLRKHDDYRLLTSESEIKRGYQLCQQNADDQGYALRSWRDFKITILELVEKGTAHFIGVFKDLDLKGAIFIVQSGGYYTYIFGGTKRENPNLLSGYVLQWEALKMSTYKKFGGYNISMGGSKGVQDFKSKFGAEAIYYELPHHYLILKPLYFKAFKFFDKYLKFYKKKLSILLSKFNRNN